MQKNKKMDIASFFDLDATVVKRSVEETPIATKTYEAVIPLVEVDKGIYICIQCHSSIQDNLVPAETRILYSDIVLDEEIPDFEESQEGQLYYTSGGTATFYYENETRKRKAVLEIEPPENGYFKPETRFTAKLVQIDPKWVGRYD